MNEIVQMVAQKFNLSPEVAQQIVGFIVAQVKGKLPEGMSSQLDGLMAGGGRRHWRPDGQGQGHVRKGITHRRRMRNTASLPTCGNGPEWRVPRDLNC